MYTREEASRRITLAISFKLRVLLKKRAFWCISIVLVVLIGLNFGNKQVVKHESVKTDEINDEDLNLTNDLLINSLESSVFETKFKDYHFINEIPSLKREYQSTTDSNLNDSITNDVESEKNVSGSERTNDTDISDVVVNFRKPTKDNWSDKDEQLVQQAIASNTVDDFLMNNHYYIERQKVHRSIEYRIDPTLELGSQRVDVEGHDGLIEYLIRKQVYSKDGSNILPVLQTIDEKYTKAATKVVSIGVFTNDGISPYALLNYKAVELDTVTYLVDLYNLDEALFRELNELTKDAELLVKEKSYHLPVITEQIKSLNQPEFVGEIEIIELKDGEEPNSL